MTGKVVERFGDGVESDEMLYRIIPIERFIQMYERKRLYLLSPAKWDDPFEKLWFELGCASPAKDMEARRRVFGLCWTKESMSDALWRIYSPNELSIRIRTTRKLLKAALRKAKALKEAYTLIGDVDYCDGKTLLKRAKALHESASKTTELASEKIAKAWLSKRTAFRHEAEVRLISVFSSTGHKDDRVEVPIDPGTLVQAVRLDPRMPVDVFESLKRHFVNSFGIEADTIQRSTLYTLPKRINALASPRKAGKKSRR